MDRSSLEARRVGRRDRVTPRRSFLSTLGIGSIAFAAGLGLPSRARARFGEVPTGVRLPFVGAESVLEIFLVGGLSHWESLYATEAYGRSDGLQLYTYRDAIAAELAACGVSLDRLVQPLGLDALGASVGLGPLAHPLWSRPDVLARSRVIVLSHGVQPHEGAVPLALTGKPLGHAAGAGLGAHVQRHLLQRDAWASGVPASWVLGEPTFNAQAAVATGLHPGSARPLHVRDVASLATAFERIDTDVASLDRLVLASSAELVRRHPGSRALSDLLVARSTLERSSTISELAASVTVAPPPITHCGMDGTSETRRALFVAARLLGDPARRVRHVCVLDRGLVPAPGGGGYDTHGDHARVQTTNATHVLSALAERIARPGETGADLIDLDRTLVIVHSEFGRTPGREGTSGRDHYPYAYPIAMIGGPITAGRGGIEGAIDAAAVAHGASTPAEARAAALLAMGIWPFAPEAFGVGDVGGAAHADEAAGSLARRFLGWELT